MQAYRRAELTVTSPTADLICDDLQQPCGCARAVGLDGAAYDADALTHTLTPPSFAVATNAAATGTSGAAWTAWDTYMSKRSSLATPTGKEMKGTQ
jgi:hypothetical protein